MKKRLALIALAALAIFPLGACGSPKAADATSVLSPSYPAQSAEAEYHKIPAEEAKKRMDQNPDAIVLDVRTQSEYEESHIPRAILIPNETIGGGRPEQLPDLDAEILVYCRSGNRSRQAAEKLVALGYTQVYDFGGIVDWPYETVSELE